MNSEYFEEKDKKDIEEVEFKLLEQNYIDAISKEEVHKLHRYPYERRNRS